jgi:hypothetical protein
MKVNLSISHIFLILKLKSFNYIIFQVKVIYFLLLYKRKILVEIKLLAKKSLLYKRKKKLHK